MATASLTSSISYFPPGSGSSTLAGLNVTSTYTAMEMGTIEIPDLTVIATVISLPFGSVDNAQALYIKNTNNQDMILRLNGSANLMSIQPGGVYMVAYPTSPSGTAISSADLVLSAAQAGDGIISYFVFGL